MTLFPFVRSFRRNFTHAALTFAGWAVLATASHADGVKPPASGELFNLASTPDLAGISTQDGATPSVTDDGGAKKLKIEIKGLTGYPGIGYPVPAGGWDLSGFTGVKIEVHNAGTETINVNLKVANEGDWKVSPWSLDAINVAAGETQTLKVRFGITFNQPGFLLDAAHVTGLQLYVLPPKSPGAIIVGNPKVYKDQDADTEPDVPVVYGPPALPKPEPEVPVFPLSKALDITDKHDLPNAATLSDEAATQLKGLGSLAEFHALPEADRHVYSFESWPEVTDSMAVNGAAIFNLNLGTEGVTNQKIAFLPDGFFPAKDHTLTRDKDGTTGKYLLGGFGNLDWGAKASHVFKFDKPLTAFGVVLRASDDMELRRFFWNGSDLNGYPVSYTLADGSVVQLGARDVQAGVLKGKTDQFLGVIDRTGRGIISVTYTVGGLAGNKGESLNLVDLIFATPPKPAVAPIVRLQGSYDFAQPQLIADTPSPALEGLASLNDFRFIVANHRYVYDFATWPQAKPDLDSNTATFSFDLKGKGEIGQKVTVTATNQAGDAKLTQATLKGDDGLPYHALGGLGNPGKDTWAEQTFKFEKPVLGFGVTYHSEGTIALGKIGESHAVSYTLTDGTVVNAGNDTTPTSTLSSKGKTFVGVIDKSDKGISSVTIHLHGTDEVVHPLYIDNLAFAFSGPPPGNWKLTMADEFDGDKLNPDHWSTGYTFPNVINNEMQAFVPENVVVANGVATIKLEKKIGTNTDRLGRTGATQQFTSGNFTSYDKFTQTYGYFEARLKMTHARGAGTWPAFWMLPDRGRDYPDDRGAYRTKDYGMGSEIDIFEFMPSWKRLDGLFPIHMGTLWSYAPESPEDPAPHGYGDFALDNDGWGPGEYHFPNADTEFHTYGIYWSKTRLIFYVDSKPVFRCRDPKNIPDVPEYFLFNVSISGNGWGKSPDKNNPTIQQIAHDMPNAFIIDYFRAYSGTLDEAVPAPPEDMPLAKKYPLPPKGATAVVQDTTAPATAPTTGNAPPAPINSTIVTPPQ